MATSRPTAQHFLPVERVQAYLETLRCHVMKRGCPLAFYSGRHGVFRINAKDAQSSDGKTELGRATVRSRIELIHALTPQAKGRVERANQTFILRFVGVSQADRNTGQDRLVKEMPL